MAAETQTCEDYLQVKPNKRKASQKLESRGSQCSGRKRSQVRISSAQTQTLESAVGSLNKRNNRSRKRSVAVITGEDLPPATQELWSDFEKFLLGIDKYSSATQTISCSDASSSTRVLKDSQTVTEKDYLLDWNSSNVGKEKIDHSEVDSTSSISWTHQNNVETSECQQISELEITPNLTSAMVNCQNPEDVGKDHKEIVVPPSLSLPDLVAEATDGVLTEQKDLITNKNLSSIYSSNAETAEHSEVTVFNDADINLILEGQFVKSDGPLLSDTQTQTHGTDALFDCGLFDFANMETQTTDDLLFPELEFSDTETQTPWDDIQTIADGNLSADQLSIEIQTDFSSICGDGNAALNSSFTVGDNANQVGTSNSGSCTFGRNIETQTQDDYIVARQFIHSEAQTHFEMGFPFY